MKSQTPLLAAVEIGSSNVKVITGTYESGRLLIRSKAVRGSFGVVKGVVTDFEAACEDTHAALDEAESAAGSPIEEIRLALTGDHIRGIYHEVAVDVSKEGPKLPGNSSADSQRGADRELPANRTIIDSIRSYSGSDARGARVPVLLEGNLLCIGRWTVHGDEKRIATSKRVIEERGRHVSELVLASLASGTAVTTPEQREAGVLVIDIGGGTTDYVHYVGGIARKTGVVPIGGEHFDNDLVRVLGVPQEQAETLKLRFGRGIVSTFDRHEKVALAGDGRYKEYSRHAIERITAGRADEIFSTIQAVLGADLEPENIGEGVVITGGMSGLPQIAQSAQKVFGLPARAGAADPLLGVTYCEPTFSTVIGMLEGDCHPEAGRK